MSTNTIFQFQSLTSESEQLRAKDRNMLLVHAM